MEFQQSQDVQHGDKETYGDRLAEPHSSLQSHTLHQEYEDPSLAKGDEMPRQLALSASTDLDELFGLKAGNPDEYHQNVGANQPFWQEAPTLPVSDNMNNANGLDDLFNGANQDLLLGSESHQMPFFSQLPDSGQTLYPFADNQLANSGPDYKNADFVGLSQLNEDNGYANVRDEAYMSSQIYQRPEYSQGPFSPVPGDFILKSNYVSGEPITKSVSSSLSLSTTTSATSRAHSFNHFPQWSGMDALLSDPEGLLSQKNTDLVLNQVGDFSRNGDSMPEHRRQWQDPAIIEQHSFCHPALRGMPDYQGRLTQNKPCQHRGFNAVEVSNGNWLDLERSFTQPNGLPYPPYLAMGSSNGPIEASYSQPAPSAAGLFPHNSTFDSNSSYPDVSFNSLSQHPRESNEPYLLHHNTPFIYDEAIPFNADMTRHQNPMDDGNTLALDFQMSAKPNPRKRFASFDDDKEEEGEEGDEDEDPYVDLEGECEQSLDSYAEDGSTQASDYAPGNQDLTKRRKTNEGIVHWPGSSRKICSGNTSSQLAGVGTQAIHTINSGTRPCQEKGTFGSESKWWARETPQTGLQVRERESDLWRHAVRHDDIRHILFRLAGNVNQYTSPRARGQEAGDETSYLPLQKHWSLENREKWKNIYGNVLTRYERKGFRAPDSIAKPRGYMTYKGRVVVDRNNRPILDWPMLPVTLSTRFEGGYIEAIRRICPDINTRDFWARMPRWAKTPSPIGGYDSRAAPDISGINMRGLRFRQQNGLIAWTSRSGSNALKEKVKSKMSQADKDNNTTENVYM